MKVLLVVLFLAFATSCAFQPAQAQAEAYKRFWPSDDSALGDTVRAFVVHDQSHADRCLLVIYQPYHGMTSQPWPCQ